MGLLCFYSSIVFTDVQTARPYVLFSIPELLLLLLYDIYTASAAMLETEKISLLQQECQNFAPTYSCPSYFGYYLRWVQLSFTTTLGPTSQHNSVSKNRIKIPAALQQPPVVISTHALHLAHHTVCHHATADAPRTYDDRWKGSSFHWHTLSENHSRADEI